MRKATFSLAAIAILAAILACNLPTTATGTQGPDAVLTAAALTVQAQLAANTPADTATAAASTATPAATTVLPTSTGVPGLTPISTCDQALFISDITYPDNTVVPSGTTFTKTWRLQNTGTCSWTPSYDVVFKSGSMMSGPSVQALTANVNPGQTVDLSVDMTGPSSNGTYTGYWGLRNGSGVIFTQFYVLIKVNDAGGSSTATSAAPTTNVVTLTAISNEGGSVRSDGTVLPGVPNAGDTETNVTSEAFFSFNISGIPAGSTISQVVPNFSSYDELGHPFTLSDGCVRPYVQAYGTSLNAGDFYSGDPLGSVGRWCSNADLNSTVADAEIVPALQAAVGSSRFQLRVQFRVPTTNNNNIADMVRFGAVKLKITYTTP